MGPRVHNRSIFDPKISIFLRYTHITPISGVRQIRPNGILSPPYAEVTLDNFSFPVGGRSVDHFQLMGVTRDIQGHIGPKRGDFPIIHLGDPPPLRNLN